MTHYDNYRKYHDALMNTNFDILSGVILSIQKIQEKYNSELGNISNSEWQDKINPVLQQKLLFSSNAIQSLNNDISINIQSIIASGSKLLEVLEQMKQKQVVIDGLTKTIYELNKEKSNSYNKLNTFQSKSTEEYNTVQSKYLSALNKYNNKKEELVTSKNEIDELGREADQLISKLQRISFTANIVGLLNGSVVAATTSSTSPTVTADQTTPPTATSLPKPQEFNNIDMKLPSDPTKFTNEQRKYLNDKFNQTIANGGPFGSRGAAVAAIRFLLYDIPFPIPARPAVANKDIGQYFGSKGLNLNPETGWGQEVTWVDKNGNRKSGINGLDCSGGTNFVLYNAGIILSPSEKLWTTSNYGPRYSIRSDEIFNVKPGDFFFHQDNSKSSSSDHIGMVSEVKKEIINGKEETVIVIADMSDKRLHETEIIAGSTDGNGFNYFALTDIYTSEGHYTMENDSNVK